MKHIFKKWPSKAENEDDEEVPKLQNILRANLPQKVENEEEERAKREVDQDLEADIK